MRQGDWIQTFTGRQFWPMDPRAEDIFAIDIAHALSNLCRYSGHCERFYSVAEHSIVVSNHVPAEHALWGLLHDASEAYLVDVPRPLKPFLSGYREAEARIMLAICERFGISADMPKEVSDIDYRILTDERMANMAPPPEKWKTDTDPIGAAFSFMSPPEAEAAFLQRLTELTAGVAVA